MTETTLPDNLIGRLTNVSISNKTFTNPEGQKIDYSRLVLVGTVKGKKFTIETKIEQKDITLLELSDTKSEREAIDNLNLEEE